MPVIIFKKPQILNGYTMQGLISNYSFNYSSQPGQPIVFERIITIQSIKDEIGAARNLNLIDNDGIKNSLIAKLNNAKKQIDSNKKDAAINVLKALVNEIEAQSGKHITKDLADLLIGDAQSLIQNLNSPTVDNQKTKSVVLSITTGLLAIGGGLIIVKKKKFYRKRINKNAEL